MLNFFDKPDFFNAADFLSVKKMKFLYAERKKITLIVVLDSRLSKIFN